MKQFIYIITEGVLDVVVLTQVLQKRFLLDVVERKSDLPKEAADWLSKFTWPFGEDIKRFAVPAPAFLQKEDVFVGLRNAQGLQKIQSTIKLDQEAFLRSRWQPTATGIVLDADDQPPAERFAEFADVLGKQGFPRPQTLDDVASADGMRAGIFAFPGQGIPGTLEDVLLPLAATRFPELWKHADQFVQDWLATDIAKSGSDFKELRKLSGPKKARLSTMVALLKPAKPLKASIEDHRWFPDDMAVRSELQPLIEFLNKLFDSSSAERQPGT